MSKVKTKNNTLFLPREKIWVNPSVFQLQTSETIYNEIPWESIRNKNFKEVYGELHKISYTDPLRNTGWDYLRFLDCSIFTPAANAFNISEKSNRGTNIKPSYTPHLKGTTPFKEFWKEELRRIMYGYEPIVDGEPCGIRIPGEYYFYLNYAVIQNIKKDSKGNVTDKRTFPSFLAMDYYYFRELEARERPDLYSLPSDYKKPLTVTKSRRKGFSFKAAAGCVWVTAFPTKDNAKVIIASDTGYDSTLCFKKAMVIVDWLTDYTPFGRKDPGSTKDNGGWKHITMSLQDDSGRFIFGLENTKTRKRIGRLTEIMTQSLANKADKISGEGVQRIYFEEAGKISDLKKAWAFARESLKAGSLWRGIAIIFGTGGSMIREDGGKGHSHDFSELFKNPTSQQLAAFDNIYEYDNSQEKCGWFVADMWANFGAEIIINGIKYKALDENGNANHWAAELCLNSERIITLTSGKKSDYDMLLTQRCKTPSEAFLVTQGTVFPTSDLLARDSYIKMGKIGYEGLRVKGELIEIGNNVTFKPDLDNRLFAIDTYPIETNMLDREGCLLRYEPPLKIDGVIPEGSYIISVDPIGQNTVAGKSLTSIIVMRTPKYAHKFGPEKIVMTYRGRAKINPQGHIHELLIKISKYYNAKITFENDRDGGILQYFIRKGELGRLMSKPEMTLSKYIPNSKTMMREYGHSMGSSRHKRIGEDLLLEWLLKRQPKRKLVDSNNEIVEVEGLRNLDMLEDKAIIEELTHYRRDGNYDSVMALMGAIIQINEHFNEDFVSNFIEDQRGETISNYWVGLHVNLYGSDKEKYDYELNKNNTNRKNKIEWQDDSF